MRSRTTNFSLFKSPKKYYEHIDGLRALAVISVLLCHLDFRLFNGGYIGVDVFFVISGSSFFVIMSDLSSFMFIIGGSSFFLLIISD